MVLDKYIKINNELIHVGQDPKTKEWYCKELPFKDDKDLLIKAKKINIALNQLNQTINKEKKKKETVDVKGLK